MIAILLLGILACAGAAPRQPANNNQVVDHQFKSSFGKFNSLTDEIFDTQRFKDEMRREIADINKRLDELTSATIPSSPTQEIEGDHFVVRMSLKGYTKKDVQVQIKDGVLLVKASHDTDLTNKYSFLTVKTLPDYVSIDGDWAITDGLLTVKLPIKRNDATPMPTSTASPVNNREELDANGADTDVQDAEVGSAGAKVDEATT